jgi:hypothetical protein
VDSWDDRKAAELRCGQKVVAADRDGGHRLDVVARVDRGPGGRTIEVLYHGGRASFHRPDELVLVVAEGVGADA